MLSDRTLPALTRKSAVLVAAMALVIAACGSDSDDTTTTTAAAGATTTTAAVTTTTTTEEPIRIGYISGGDADAFVFQVTTNITDVAAEEGAELFSCDANFTAEEALECARNLSAQNLDVMINWQFIAAASEAVCEAYGNLPTVTMDVPEEPCGVVFVGADNLAAGLIAGTGLGEFAESEFGCEYDLYVSIELPGQPDINDQRAGGTTQGFEDVCGAIDSDKFVQIDKAQGASDATENIRRVFTDVLTANPGAEVILIAAPFGDIDGVTALAAADTADRSENVWVVAHGGDAAGQNSIRSDPRWIGSVAYFPERYGTLAVPAAIALARGETVPENILLTHELITAENIDEFYPLS